jgi:uncharacterized protein (TIGR00290 family)
MKAMMSWSGGKDSAMALHRAQTQGVDVVGLLTTTNEAHDRIAIHGVRRELLEMQAKSIGLPLTVVPLPDACVNEEYERRMGAAMRKIRDEAVTHVIHGDLFLEDIRAYRERNLARIGLKGLFPLWGEDTKRLAHSFVADGWKATVCCVDTAQLDGAFCGRAYDQAFVDDLPAGVDPCGEKGEFHSFAWAGPIFRVPLRHQIGERVLRGDRFLFTDLVPSPDSSPSRPQGSLSARMAGT